MSQAPKIDHIPAKVTKTKSTKEGTDSKDQSSCISTVRVECDVCGVWKPSIVSYYTHMYHIHNTLVDGAKEHKCYICNKIFMSKGYMDSHIKKYHEDRSPRSCPFCGKIKRGAYGLQDHIAQVHNTPRFVCDLCGQTCVTNSRLKTHKKEKHDRQRLLTCTVTGCSSSFYRLNSLKIHMKNVHEKVKDFSCGWPECGRQFHSRYSVKRHELLHSGDKPISCQYCKYTCRQASSLKLHVKNHHKVDDVSTGSQRQNGNRQYCGDVVDRLPQQSITNSGIIHDSYMLHKTNSHEDVTPKTSNLDNVVFSSSSDILGVNRQLESSNQATVGILRQMLRDSTPDKENKMTGEPILKSTSIQYEPDQLCTDVTDIYSANLCDVNDDNNDDANKCVKVKSGNYNTGASSMIGHNVFKNIGPVPSTTSFQYIQHTQTQVEYLDLKLQNNKLRQIARKKTYEICDKAIATKDDHDEDLAAMHGATTDVIEINTKSSHHKASAPNTIIKPCQNVSNHTETDKLVDYIQTRPTHDVQLQENQYNVGVKYSISGESRTYQSPIVIDTVDKVKTYQCTLCEGEYLLKNDYLTHLHHIHSWLPDDVTALQCTQCEKVLFNQLALEQHEKQVHSARLPCKLCGKMLKPGYLASHEKNVHHGLGDRFLCKVCDRRCVSRSRLKFHMLECHENVRRFSCPETGCTATFLRLTSYRNHMDEVHKKMKNYLCSWEGCSKAFSRPEHLRRHILIHTGDKPIKCQLCHYSCRQKTLLKSHIKSFHQM